MQVLEEKSVEQTSAIPGQNNFKKELVIQLKTELVTIYAATVFRKFRAGQPASMALRETAASTLQQPY